MALSFLDWFFIILSISIIIPSTLRGFIRTFFSILSFLIGTASAFFFFRKFSPFFVHTFSVPLWIAHIMAFFALFIVVFLIIKYVQMIMNMLVSYPILRSLNRALGFFFGVAESLLVIAVILILLKIQPFTPPERFLANSVIAELVFPIINAVSLALPILPKTPFITE